MNKFFVPIMKLITIVVAAVLMLSGFSCFAEQNEELDLMINEELDTGEWWNILLLGTDSRDITKYYGLTDTIVILSVNTRTNEVKLTSIMRDTWVHIYGKGEEKINAANSRGGPELVMRTVNEYFGMNISDYVLVGMEALADIIDEIGGVEISISEDEMKQINTQLKYDAAEFELNHSEPLEIYGEDILLNGNQALAYARIRSIDSDYVRTERQRNVLVAIVRKLQNEDVASILSVVGTLLGYVNTNLTFSEVAMLSGIGLQVDLNDIEQMRLPADGTYTTTTENGQWSIRADFDQNTDILHEFIYGMPDESKN